MGITHIMVRYDLFHNWMEYNLGPEKQIIAQYFFV